MVGAFSKKKPVHMGRRGKSRGQREILYVYFEKWTLFVDEKTQVFFLKIAGRSFLR